MSLAESISLAFSSLKSNKMRSLLTLLGVIIGIASVIAILTLGKALQTQTLQGLEEAGANDYNLSVQQRNQDGEDNGMSFGSSSAIDRSSKITVEMIDQLKARFPEMVEGVNIGDASNHSGRVELGLQSVSANLKGVNADYMKMRNVRIQYGRALTQDDIEGDRPVAVISPEVFKDIFNSDAERALGSEFNFVTSGGTGEIATFVVVGIYEKASSSGLVMGPEQSNIFVPYPSEQRISNAEPLFDYLSVRTARTGDDSQVKEDLQRYVDTWYADNLDYEVKVSDLKNELEQFNSVLRNMSIALSAIGGISLLVGGIGVMNIMLITVTERTREIGVRKALGATRRHIRTQFVVEAMIVCLIGGIIGVLLGSSIGMMGAKLMGNLVFPPIGGIIVSLLFALGIGLFFGYYPANKAAKLDPIEALRYE